MRIFQGAGSGIALLFIGWAFSMQGQTGAYINIVPNAGFEEQEGVLPVWFYKGDDFTQLVNGWSSPTGASPDAYGPRVNIPEHWGEKGFGKEKPYRGKAMVGITTYGCENGKPHCREYLQIKIQEPLVYGQTYTCSFWVKKLNRAGACDQLGIAFSYKKIAEKTSDLLKLQPTWACNVAVGSWVEKWQKISGTFKATGEESWLIIGNFNTDKETLFTPAKKGGLPFCYYYIDEVELVKIPPLVRGPMVMKDLKEIDLEVGLTVRLPRVHFDHDKTVLLPESIEELDQLRALLIQNPKMVIAILGHTDNDGTPEYNLDLSARRALAVADYLYEKGIEHHRLRWQGYGETIPTADNGTPEGRRINRRVEFKIIAL